MKIRQSNAAPVGVLTKVLSIFELLDQSSGALPLRAIAERTGFNKSTTYRFLAHLEKAGYLVRDDQGGYLLGPHLVRLGSGSKYQLTIRSVSRPTLELLWRDCGETVNLGVLDGREILYLDVLESAHNFRLVSQIGSRRPLHCTGLGKVILSCQSPDVRDELIGSIHLEKITSHSIIRKSALMDELSRIQRRGYAVDNEEAVLGARCVAVPIWDSSNCVVAGISVSGPVTRMTKTRTTEIAAALKEASAAISKRLGFNEAPAAE